MAPPLTWTNSQHSRMGAMTGVTVRDISQEAIADFWRQNDYISSQSHLKGLNWRVALEALDNALESYINNFIVEKVSQ